MTTDKKKLRRYCTEYWKIENYNRATKSPEKWHLHHRDEDLGYTAEELKAAGLYYHLPQEKLIFLPAKEHISSHSVGKPCPFKGKHHTDEAKQKMYAAHKGKTSHNKGVPLSEDTKEKMSISLKSHWESNKHPMKGKHHSEETKKKLSEKVKDMWNDPEYREKCSGKNSHLYIDVCPLLLFRYRVIEKLPYNKIRERLKTECGITIGTMAVYRKIKDLNIQ